MTRLSFRTVADATFYEEQVASGSFVAGLRSPLQIIERTGYVAIDIAGIAFTAMELNILKRLRDSAP